jgi:6-phosphogluconolactonase
MTAEVKIFNTTEELGSWFASMLEIRISESPADRSFSWMLSGGSTPIAIFKKVAASVTDPSIWSRVKLFWCDERCVDPGNSESNYKMAMENLIIHVPVQANNIFRIRGEDSPAAEAVRYSDQFTRHVHQFQGIPVVDLVMLGMGEDGHTASVFPGNIELFYSEKLFEPSEHPVTKQMRITATGSIINRAKLVVILATGEAKAAITAQVINKSDGWEKLPAGRVHPENGELLWLLDQKSAYKLK